ncbi:enoyl-[acyl-carrier-protein] reductase [NADH] [Hasllibacter halocynthiae]|uniref:Enoyl-[acyl-carrier-protein] reductase [NADH] n=1 Tax=Hasllibacter halocynthiae TaxID=595589 RepID=A0A2T0X168_9RHOB|nr:enoyl-ACP reductase [Hasllibacter halocynthiae]PRY92667.1 enoyl-[acyl-carrier-protein] reductase [NADH] [Hasllibacter halocynthiae]
MGLMDGKRGVVMGVANDHSIAYGIARALHAEGAELITTYQGETFGKRAAPLAHSLDAVAFDVDVTDPASMDALLENARSSWSGVDFVVHAIAYTDKSELSSGFAFRETSRANFLKTMEISAWSFIDTARRFAPMMEGGGALLTLTYAGSHKVTPNYNVMGVAKAALEASVIYLADDLGPQGVRVNALSPGPMKTLAGSAIGGARRTYKHTEANAPLRENASLGSIGGTAVWLCSDWGRHTTGETIMIDGGYHVMGMPVLDNLSGH